jgi:type I restriction enzyme S subunit
LVNTGVRNNGLLNIRPADFFRVQIPVPPVDEQRSIAGIMDTANQSLCAMERNIEKLKTEKAALMQQLLTGKRRVRVPVRAMETEPA